MELCIEEYIKQVMKTPFLIKRSWERSCDHTSLVMFASHPPNQPLRFGGRVVAWLHMVLRQRLDLFDFPSHLLEGINSDGSHFHALELKLNNPTK